MSILENLHDMSHTFRYNPDTQKKEVERRYVHRKIERTKEQKRNDEYFDALIDTKFLEKDDDSN
jgi:hypothetical protein